MLKLNGVSAWVEVDGKELEQYGVEESPEQNLVTCWIATQPGKNFSVVYRDNAPYRDHALASMLSLDGTACPGRILHNSAMKPNYDETSRRVVQADRTVSVTSKRPFVFAKLELTDEDEYLDQTPKHLGEIQISVSRCHVLGLMHFTPMSEVTRQTKVHERAKKAVSHSVSYGQETQSETNYRARVHNLDGLKPLATFVFKYRDYSLLQANGIVPRPEENRAASEEALDLTTRNEVKQEQTGDEIDELDAAILAMQRKRAALVQKRSNGGAGDAPPAKRVKREKFSPTARSSEVIDLT